MGHIGFIGFEAVANRKTTPEALTARIENEDDWRNRQTPNAERRTPNAERRTPNAKR